MGITVIDEDELFELIETRPAGKPMKPKKKSKRTSKTISKSKEDSRSSEEINEKSLTSEQCAFTGNKAEHVKCGQEKMICPLCRAQYDLDLPRCQKCKAENPIKAKPIVANKIGEDLKKINEANEKLEPVKARKRLEKKKTCLEKEIAKLGEKKADLDRTLQKMKESMKWHMNERKKSKKKKKRRRGNLIVKEASKEEVNVIKEDGQVIHFNNPKVQASLAANTFAITGHAENKQIAEMLPGILNQLGAESLSSLKKLAQSALGGEKQPQCPIADDDEEVPELVENFDEASKDEDI